MAEWVCNACGCINTLPACDCGVSREQSSRTSVRAFRGENVSRETSSLHQEMLRRAREFQGLPREELVKKCREFAAEFDKNMKVKQ